MLLVLAASLTAALVGSASANVDLEWRPSQATIGVGESLFVDLYAVADNPTGHLISAIDAIILWDPSYLDFWGLVGDPQPYWMVDGFLDAPGGINDDPYFDGDAMYTAWANFGEDVLVTQDGLLCATFEWRGLQITDLTEVTIPALCGQAATAVYDGTSGNNDIKGELGGIEVTIVPEPCASLVFSFGLLPLLRRRSR